MLKEDVQEENLAWRLWHGMKQIFYSSPKHIPTKISLVGLDRQTPPGFT